MIEFNAELAWDIQEWNETSDERRTTVGQLSRNDLKLLAEFLTEKGYTKGGKSGFGGLFSQLEEVGAKVVDEFGPLIDSLRKPK